jgi:membrane protease YdiL (CAAX protease family)
MMRHPGFCRLIALLAATTAYAHLLFWLAGDAFSETGYYLLNKSLLAVLLLAYVAATGQVRAAGLTGTTNFRTLPLYWPLFLLMGLILAGPVSPPDPRSLLALAGIAVAVGFAEELMFRGLVFHWFRDQPVRRTVLISAAAFGVAHLTGLLVSDAVAVILAQSVFASAVGAVLACARARDHSIWLPVAVHAGFDFVALAAAGSIGSAFEDSPATVLRLLIPGILIWLWAAWLIRRLPGPTSPAELALSPPVSGQEAKPVHESG